MDSIVSQLQSLFPFDASQRSLWISLAAITFNPTAWNIVARNGELAVFEEPLLQFACDYGRQFNWRFSLLLSTSRQVNMLTFS